MKKLILFRHAKSDWNGLTTDFDRKITQSGVENTIKIAELSKDEIIENFQIWSSPAKRAFETAKIAIKEWNLAENQIISKEELYTFEGNQLEKNIKLCANTIDRLIIFGHNEAITEIVNKFGDVYIDNVPTSGFVLISFKSNDWSGISEGKTEKYLFPKELNL